MKRFSQRSGYSTMAELNITPLLDLAFVLLIIFMITTPLMENSMEVNLPSAKSTQPPVNPEVVRTITVDRQGAIFLEKERIAPSLLEATLLRLKRDNPEVAVVLRADRETRYQQLVDVFDALQRAQITKVGLVHNPPS